MLFAVTGWGLAYMVASVFGVLFFCLFCMGICSVVLIELPQWLFEVQYSYEAREACMFISFFVGFMVGLLLGTHLSFELAVWLGFRQGDLPTLPKLF